MKGNKKYLYLLLVISIMGLLTGCIKKKVEIKDITSLHYSYSKGYAMNAYVVYELDSKDDEYLVKIKPDGKPEEEADYFHITKEKVEELATKLNKTKVYRWDGFNKADKNVLDGNSFSFSLRFGEEKSISAHGYMMYPIDYGDIKTIVEEWFISIKEEALE